MKTCTRCKQEKPLHHFGKFSDMKDGLHYYCKRCISEKHQIKVHGGPPNLGICARCKERPKRKIGSAYCYECQAELVREWSKKNPAKKRASLRGWRQRNKDVVARQNFDAKMRRRYRCRVLLGGKCACCDESRDSFLDIDHIHGGGSQERREKGPAFVYSNVLKMENPRIKYQLLCSNCNQSKRRLGKCEHESEREMASAMLVAL